ncbi:hypothetical protein ACFS2C_23485 [Prauserella oleivorans]|uniref:Uncharacterized protein n=1 Tax=Prauserella oleivorans TaxID=1478153 RepID=A0ABW5WGM8_9PSEU
MQCDVSIRYNQLAGALSVPDGGFSIIPSTGANVTRGYAVSVHPECERVLPGIVQASDLARYADEHAATLALPGRVFGGWRDPESGAAFLDVSVVVPELGDALTLAHAHGQLAVFDFLALTSVPVTSVPAAA